MLHKRGQRHIIFEVDDVPAPPEEEKIVEPEPEPPAPTPSFASLKLIVAKTKGKSKAVPALVPAAKEEQLQEIAALSTDAPAVDETPNHMAAMLMVQQLDSLPGSPWIIDTISGEHDLLAQLLYGLQNPTLDLFGIGFIINLDKHGRQLRFTKAWPKVAQEYPLEDRTAIFGEGAVRCGNRSIVDLTYWNVQSSWTGHIRALTIPTCRVSGFRGPLILGTGVKSVRRSLISFSRFCPCHSPFHVTARGDDGRTLQGQDLGKFHDHGGPGPDPDMPTKWHWDGQPIDPFPKD